MPPTTRRRFLGLVGAAGVGGLAGCNAAEESSASRLGELPVANHDTRAYRVHLVLLGSGDPVYWRSKRVSAATGYELGGAVFEDFPVEPGEYELHARLDDGHRSGWAAFDVADRDAPCPGLSVHIGDTTGERSVWYATNPRVCEPETEGAERRSTVDPDGFEPAAPPATSRGRGGHPSPAVRAPPAPTSASSRPPPRCAAVPPGG